MAKKTSNIKTFFEELAISTAEELSYIETCGYIIKTMMHPDLPGNELKSIFKVDHRDQKMSNSIEYFFTNNSYTGIYTSDVSRLTESLSRDARLTNTYLFQFINTDEINGEDILEKEIPEGFPLFLDGISDMYAQIDLNKTELDEVQQNNLSVLVESIAKKLVRSSFQMFSSFFHKIKKFGLDDNDDILILLGFICHILITKPFASDSAGGITHFKTTNKLKKNVLRKTKIDKFNHAFIPDVKSSTDVSKICTFTYIVLEKHISTSLTESITKEETMTYVDNINCINDNGVKRDYTQILLNFIVTKYSVLKLFYSFMYQTLKNKKTETDEQYISVLLDGINKTEEYNLLSMMNKIIYNFNIWTPSTLLFNPMTIHTFVDNGIYEYRIITIPNANDSLYVICGNYFFDESEKKSEILDSTDKLYSNIVHRLTVFDLMSCFCTYIYLSGKDYNGKISIIDYMVELNKRLLDDFKNHFVWLLSLITHTLLPSTKLYGQNIKDISTNINNFFIGIGGTKNSNKNVLSTLSKMIDFVSNGSSNTYDLFFYPNFLILSGYETDKKYIVHINNTMRQVELRHEKSGAVMSPKSDEPFYNLYKKCISSKSSLNRYLPQSKFNTSTFEITGNPDLSSILRDVVYKSTMFLLPGKLLDQISVWPKFPTFIRNYIFNMGDLKRISITTTVIKLSEVFSSFGSIFSVDKTNDEDIFSYHSINKSNDFISSEKINISRIKTKGENRPKPFGGNEYGIIFNKEGNVDNVVYNSFKLDRSYIGLIKSFLWNRLETTTDNIQYKGMGRLTHNKKDGNEETKRVEISSEYLFEVDKDFRRVSTNDRTKKSDSVSVNGVNGFYQFDKLERVADIVDNTFIMFYDITVESEKLKKEISDNIENMERLFSLLEFCRSDTIYEFVKKTDSHLRKDEMRPFLIDTFSSVKSVALDDLKTYLNDGNIVGNYGALNMDKCTRFVNVMVPGSSNDLNSGSGPIRNSRNVIKTNLIYSTETVSSGLDKKLYSIKLSDTEAKFNDKTLTSLQKLNNTSGFEIKLSNSYNPGKLSISENPGHDVDDTNIHLQTFLYNEKDVISFRDSLIDKIKKFKLDKSNNIEIPLKYMNCTTETQFEFDPVTISMTIFEKKNENETKTILETFLEEEIKKVRSNLLPSNTNKFIMMKKYQ